MLLAYQLVARMTVVHQQQQWFVQSKTQYTVTKETRDGASTSMYLLTFRVRITTPLQYGRNWTASLQITSRTQQARGFCRWRGESSPACVVHAVSLADYR